MTDKARKAIIDNAQRMLAIDWFRKDGRVAYGITEAFTSREDETFKAGMAATKAAVALLKSEAQPSSNFLSFFFPTVVLDSRLFECYLGANGGPVLREVDSASLLFPIRIGEHIGTSVQIVTLAAFDSYCEQLASVYQMLKRELAEEIVKAGVSLGLKPEALLEVERDNRSEVGSAAA